MRRCRYYLRLIEEDAAQAGRGMQYCAQRRAIAAAHVHYRAQV
jgi:hypothetical protein